MVVTLALLTPFILIVERIRLRRAYNRFVQDLRAENAKRVHIAILRSEYEILDPRFAKSVRGSGSPVGFCEAVPLSAKRFF